MADLSRITTKDPALQKVQDAVARALRGVPPATPAPLSASLSADVTVTATAWADVAGMSASFVAGLGERVLVCVAGCATAGTGILRATISVGGVDIVSSATGLARIPASVARDLGISYLTDPLTAGSTTIKLRVKVASDTSTLHAPMRLSIVRLGVAW